MELLLSSSAIYSSLTLILFSMRTYLSWLFEDSSHYTQFAIIAPAAVLALFLLVKLTIAIIRPIRKIFYKSGLKVKNYIFVIGWLLRKNSLLEREVLSLKVELEQTNNELKRMVETWTPKPSQKSIDAPNMKKKTKNQIKPKPLPALMEYDFVDEYQNTKTRNVDDGTWADYISLY